jgi:hypothetical protein
MPVQSYTIKKLENFVNTSIKWFEKNLFGQQKSPANKLRAFDLFISCKELTAH